MLAGWLVGALVFIWTECTKMAMGSESKTVGKHSGSRLASQAAHRPLCFCCSLIGEWGDATPSPPGARSPSAVQFPRWPRLSSQLENGNITDEHLKRSVGMKWKSRMKRLKTTENDGRLCYSRIFTLRTDDRGRLQKTWNHMCSPTNKSWTLGLLPLCKVVDVNKRYIFHTFTPFFV